MKISIKILLIIIISLSFVSCSNNLYVEKMENGYWRDKTDKTLYIKDDANYNYMKKKIKYKVYDNQHYLVIKQDKKTGEKSLYLALKYRGDNWIYMNSLDLIGDKNEIVHIDFMARKMSTAMWKDHSNMVDSVEEYIAFKLNIKEIEKLENIIKNNKILSIKYYGELDKVSKIKEINKKEIKNMKGILKLYGNNLRKK